MYIDPHIHMTSRTVDDLIAMRQAGIVAIIEPAFWLGQPRTQVGTFQDYFNSLIGWERFRAGQFGIRHYCTMGLNPKEANQAELAEAVIALLPYYLNKEGVVAVGEIGFDDQTPLEEKYFRAQLELAKQAKLPVMIHTPHRDKEQGTLRSIAICLEHQLEPEKIIIDHNNECTVKAVLDNGFWAAFTIYPKTKMGSERFIDIVKQYGATRIFMDSAADWGYSDPLAVPKTAALMQQHGIDEETIHRVCYQHALMAYGQSGEMREEDWLKPHALDQQALFNGNSVLRGQEAMEMIPALMLDKIE